MTTRSQLCSVEQSRDPPPSGDPENSTDVDESSTIRESVDSLCRDETDAPIT